MEELVSIVIPTCNRPVYLERTIESVLNQTYSNVEVIVVDDNNPDTDARTDTERVMTKYENNTKVTYLQHVKNKNGSAARNTGWKKAKGKYITFLDDDDEIAATKIEKQVKCLGDLDESWGACYTSYRLVKENGTNQISSENRSGYLYIEALMRTLYMGSGSNLFLRKSVVDEIGGYDESFQRNQDIEFMARALENYKLAYIDEPLLIIHQEGQRVNRSFDKIESYTMHYLEKMKSRIVKLSKKDQKRVYNVISLERARVAVQKGLNKEAVRIIVSEKVSIIALIKYIIYLIKRVVTHKSYGFSL